MKKILIIRLSALGDTIHTLPLAAALRSTYPDAKIGWVVEDKAQEFIIDNPLIDKIHVIPKNKWKNSSFLSKLKEFFKIMNDIKKENYDIALDTQQLLKSGIVLFFCGAKQKITLSGGREFSQFFANKIVKAKTTLKDPHYHVIKRHLELAEYLGCNCNDIRFQLPKLSDDLKSVVNELIKNIDKDKKTIVLSPSTTWETKHADNSFWQNIINTFIEKANIIITAQNSEKDLINDILSNSNSKKVINLTGKTNLKELREIFSRADVVLSPDSGSAHIAWAVQKPFVITLFTATSNNRTAPFGENCKSFAPQNLSCYPCHKKNCKNKKAFLECRKKINYTEIIELIESKL